MNITFRGPANEIITAGYGVLAKGKAKEVSDQKYAYDLCATGRCDPSDDAAKAEYVAMRAAAIKTAIAADKSLYCDQCLNEIDAKQIKSDGCERCKPTPVKETVESAPEVK